MSCCNGKLEKIENIIEGNVLNALDNLFLLPAEKHKQKNIRLAICRSCPKQTWLIAIDYLNWLKLNKIEVIKNLNDLSVLPELEKKEYQKRTKLFCRICKCWLPAKAYVENEQCPLNKW